MPRYLIAYDITLPRTRSRVVSRLERQGATRLQKSVFLLEGTSAALARLEASLLAVLEDTDSLLLIPCCDACFAAARQSGPEPPLTLVA